MTPSAGQRLFRPSARVVLVDETGCTLMFRIVDPLDDKPPVWITPGGAIEPGEALAEAACRELWEETGLLVDPTELGNPLAVTRGEWVFRGAPIYSEDWFFGLRTHRFEPSVTGWTDVEREVHDSWRWWSQEDLDGEDEVVLPARLVDAVRLVAGVRPPVPIELPWTVV